MVQRHSLFAGSSVGALFVGAARLAGPFGSRAVTPACNLKHVYNGQEPAHTRSAWGCIAWPMHLAAAHIVTWSPLVPPPPLLASKQYAPTLIDMPVVKLVVNSQ